jgi:hypothetical protein
MGLVSMPDAILRSIGEFTSINNVLDTCCEFIHLRHELYEYALGEKASRLFLHSHCRESYILDNGDYYCSDVTYNRDETLPTPKRKSNPNRKKRPFHFIFFNSERQIAFFRCLCRVHLSCIDQDTDRFYNNELLFSHCGSRIVGLSVDNMRHVYMKHLTNLVTLRINKGTDLDFRLLPALQNLSVFTKYHYNKYFFMTNKLRNITIEHFSENQRFIIITTDAIIDNMDIWVKTLANMTLSIVTYNNIIRGTIHINETDVLYRISHSNMMNKIPSHFQLYKYEAFEETRDTHRITRLDNQCFLIEPL